MASKLAIIGANGNMGAKRMKALTHAFGATFTSENIVASDLSLPGSPKFEEILKNPDIDKIILSTPNLKNRDEMMLAALAAKKHLLVEKPLATSPQTMKEAFSLARKNNLVLKTAYNLEFSPSVQALKKNMSRVGAPRAISAFYANGWFNPLQKIQHWILDPNYKEGVEDVMGCHLFSLLWLFAGKQKIIRKNIQKQSVSYPPLSDTATITIQTESVLFNAMVSWVYWKNTFNFEVIGPDGLGTINSLVKYIRYGQTGEELKIIERQKSLPKEETILFNYDNVDKVSADLELLDVEMKFWIDQIKNKDFDLETEKEKNEFIYECTSSI